MTGKGGSGGGFRIFPELRKVLGCHMPNFRSLGQSLHIDNFCKIDGGGGGAPYYPFVPQSPIHLHIMNHDMYYVFVFILLMYTFRGFS